MPGISGERFGISEIQRIALPMRPSARRFSIWSLRRARNREYVSIYTLHLTLSSGVLWISQNAQRTWLNISDSRMHNTHKSTRLRITSGYDTNYNRVYITKHSSILYATSAVIVPSCANPDFVDIAQVSLNLGSLRVF